MILSEGHIRCLGLAILMAKNAVENCPVIVFDDAVNAIDDDHRSGIWRTLFQDGLVGDKQIVLTSHAEEFLQRIEQGMDAQRVKNDVRRFKFLPHDGEHELRVDTDAPTKNYVSLAQQDFDQDSKRDALRNCRYGLENLTDCGIGCLAGNSVRLNSNWAGH
jgi:wobble nucleotide-excising tRNase